MTTVDRIMALSGSMPNPLAHRHWLEQLPPRQQKSRLDDLIESEERFLKRDPLHCSAPWSYRRSTTLTPPQPISC